ncbi:Endoplasmic reticulum mannosyl-oligosaccharide 1,2-alpha-mannosidase [Cytospora mali]|uniref:alpha-1,2-Mannosidase n=1 Tax=Cytospora mali TaxID=578113 RepID=A0A194W1R9_CYTMA|nr:Endoplasmic reticulum mannosyl-oligosaccharide 1,2-alpha-mannosidase [Valsa mali]
MAILSTHRKPLRLVVFVAVVLLLSFYTLSDRFDFEAPLALYVNQPYAYVRSSFDWARRKQKYPVSSYETLPKEAPHQLPKIQFDFKQGEGIQESRRSEVKKTFQKCWRSYRKHAWGFDELTPISLRGADTFSGWGATLVDSLDALWVMDLQHEFKEAVHHVVGIDWDAHPDHDVCSLFETNIRYLGGLLAAYDLSGETVLLRKANELGNMLFNAFDTPNRMPANSFHFERAKESLLLPSTREISANVGSLSMEFTRLSQLTGDPKFFDAITRVKKQLERSQDGTKLPGMWPTFVDVQNGFLTPDSSFTLGSMADSLYEYLPKMYALLGGVDDSYKKMYVKAMDTAKAFLLFRPMVPDEETDILFSGTVLSNGNGIIDLMPQGQHLTCFVGGMFALGGKLFDNEEDVEIGAKLARGCAWAYKAMPTGVMPEEFTLIPCKEANLAKCKWDEERWGREGKPRFPKGFSSVHAPGYMLRPEAIESVFVLYRITGDPAWQDVAWDMFQSIKGVTETKYAHSAIEDVTRGNSPKKLDSMESFWLAETLKYFYLIFSEPDLMSLDDFVLNTEAHPLRIPKP